MLSTLLLPTDPAPVDFPIPALRWAFRDEYSPSGELLVDVLHYVDDDGRFVSRVSTVEVERDGRFWSFHAIDGDDLDDSTEILLSADLSRDHRGGRCAFRIDGLDMAIERCRIALESRLDRSHGCEYGVARSECSACQVGAL